MLLCVDARQSVAEPTQETTVNSIAELQKAVEPDDGES